MIEVNGLSDSIFEAMMINAQNKIVQDIMNAASAGKTSVVIKEKGATAPFLMQLEEEGVFHLDDEDGKIKLFWEW
ncbi:hypothetical protein [Enterococcus faecalis]|uniref:hypothetical protein n=1 Tax=Enterococcus faecalis TaxID=1351 RepID=UPI000D510123|nr:hypothetical protein [Enterococcus faecalis]MDU6566491.1 hypothetical protein [Enterococcus faecalis]MUN46102.1 hypothetical protein [Enterococcus faecalis]PVE30688.1 hypothetical protein DC007_13030 [Enterococcus faecalis]HCY8956414.1 hypothetical protein [Enterococcus faecalis]